MSLAAGWRAEHWGRKETWSVMMPWVRFYKDISLMRKGCRNWACLVWRRLREDLINAYKYLKGRCQEDGARFSLVVPTEE